MNHCDYCGGPVSRDRAKRQTRPVKYCSDKCKAAAFRLRQRLFEEHGVTSLVETVRGLLFVKCDDSQAAINAALVELAQHPLIRFSLVEPQAPGLSLSSRAARVRPAPALPADPAQEENIFVEMEGER